jgi:hypothetical protein
MMNDVTSNSFTAFEALEKSGKVFKGFGEGASKKLGPIMALIDYRGKLNNWDKVSNDPNSSTFEQIDAGFDLVASGANVLGGSLPGAIIGGLDGATEGLTGKNFRQLSENSIVKNETNFYNQKGFEEWAHNNGLDGEIYKWEDNGGGGVNTYLEHYNYIKNLWEHDKGSTYLKWKKRKNSSSFGSSSGSSSGSSPCGPPSGGTRKPSPFSLTDISTALMEIFSSHDPNEMIGPEGQPDVHWVSVKDRMPHYLFDRNRL